jgi:hypothetical protein|tara:strand:+ start:101 stop:292 length:192 start_codon:yes stop_codon:yes gene_type:complete
MKTIQLLVNDTKGAKFSHLTELKGNKKEKLESVLNLFEDILAQHLGVDLSTNSLEIVDAVALG